MATTAFETHLATQQKTGGFWTRLTDAAANWMVRIADMSAGAQAARHAGYLASLTDAQLAERGLTRDQIVSYAFRNLTTR